MLNRSFTININFEKNHQKRKRRDFKNISNEHYEVIFQMELKTQKGDASSQTNSMKLFSGTIQITLITY